MAKPKAKKTTTTNRPKPLVHTPGLTKTKRRFGCGGALSKKKSS